MKKQLLRRALTAVVAFALIGGTVTAPVGDKTIFSSMINAEAETLGIVPDFYAVEFQVNMQKNY